MDEIGEVLRLVFFYYGASAIIPAVELLRNWKRVKYNGKCKMQKIDLCVIQDDDLAQVFLDMDQRPAVKQLSLLTRSYRQIRQRFLRSIKP